MLILTPGATTLDQLETLWRQGLAARLSDDCRAPVQAAAEIVAAAAAGQTAVYGVNTGFG
ncbi:MAG: aromatic amino acid lyase, partial [Rhodobacteraceae bacterium]|nr:aromatic amino acid lyase [Paracoccaceae bacterium]